AICILRSTDGRVGGMIYFAQETSKAHIHIQARLSCFPRTSQPGALHGIHICENGDLTHGCRTAGLHWNPYGLPHGGPGSKLRHEGDLGNVQVGPDGMAFFEAADARLTLFGPMSIFGRAVVVCEREDDLGKGAHPDSMVNGNSGECIAQGVICLTK
ncbi:Superoxide dismutase [Cu-Zn], partial [Lunasporangiospora selenospora]